MSVVFHRQSTPVSCLLSPNASTNSLRQLLLRHGPLPEAEAVKITFFVLDYFVSLEQQGTPLPHLSSEQILLLESGEIRVTIVLSEQTPLSYAFYAAPERSPGQRANSKSAIYQAGILLYEMLAGMPPFGGDTPAAVHLLHRYEPLPQLPDTITPLVREAVNNATCKTPALRFSSFPEMQKAIQPFPETEEELEIRLRQQKREARKFRLDALKIQSGEMARGALTLLLKTSTAAGLIAVTSLSIRSVYLQQLRESHPPFVSAHASPLPAKKKRGEHVSQIAAQPADFPLSGNAATHLKHEAKKETHSSKPSERKTNKVKLEKNAPETGPSKRRVSLDDFDFSPVASDSPSEPAPEQPSAPLSSDPVAKVVQPEP